MIEGDPPSPMRRFSMVLSAALMLAPAVTFASGMPCVDSSLISNMYTISRLRHSIRPTARCVNDQARLHRQMYGQDMMDFTTGMKTYTEWRKQFEPVEAPKQEDTSSRKIYRWVPGMWPQ